MKIVKLLKVFFVTVICIVIVGCVTEVSGKRNTLNTEKGRQEAVQAYIDLALGYIREGQTEEAKQPLVDALKIEPNSADVNAMIAYVFQLEQNYKDADIYFKKALSSDPSSSRILNNYGVFLFSQNRLDESKKYFLKALDDPFYSERSMVFENIGLVDLQQNNLIKAEENFRQALLLNRSRVVAILGLTQVYYQKKNYPTALNYYNTYVSMMGDVQSPQGLSLGIRLSNAMNDKASAAKYATQLEQLYPKSVEYREYKAGSK